MSLCITYEAASSLKEGDIFFMSDSSQSLYQLAGPACIVPPSSPGGKATGQLCLPVFSVITNSTANGTTSFTAQLRSFTTMIVTATATVLSVAIR